MKRYDYKKIIIISFSVILLLFLTSFFFFYKKSSYATVKINSIYNDFSVSIDGQPVENAKSLIKLRVGKHLLTAKKEDYEPIELYFELKKKETKEIKLNFELLYNDNDDPELIN